MDKVVLWSWGIEIIWKRETNHHGKGKKNHFWRKDGNRIALYLKRLQLCTDRWKYQVSYQRTWNYTVKYKSGGVDPLRSRRGKRKTLRGEEKGLLSHITVKNGYREISGYWCLWKSTNYIYRRHKNCSPNYRPTGKFYTFSIVYLTESGSPLTDYISVNATAPLILALYITQLFLCPLSIRLRTAAIPTS